MNGEQFAHSSYFIVHSYATQPPFWRCLNLGFFLLITYSLPLRRTILQSTLRFLMDVLTFMVSFSCQWSVFLSCQWSVISGQLSSF